jgi:Macrocin-O-methyltransferase (TylF)/Methyltransferase domain
MFPFWHDVVGPVIEAAEAKRIVEVGALRGEHTELMLQRLGPNVELHVIDPTPFFDPAEHERRFAGQYVFHRDLSVNALRDLAPVDVALIDGDHNWYTVFTELGLLAAVARRADAPLPVVVLHDVGWPYGRRDLYYDPSTIPAEHQQPWRRAGMRRGEPRLLPRGGGLNANLAHAEVEGGPRNGVMTAIEDFIAGHDRPLRLVVLPSFFGLAIVVEEERLAAQPALAAVLEHLEGPEGKDMLLSLCENIRVDSVMLDQALLQQSGDRYDALTSRYLETVKRAILVGPHIDTPVDGEEERRHDDAASVRAGLDHLQSCLDTAWHTLVPGDMAVSGPSSAGSAAIVAAFLESHDQATQPNRQRKLWIAGSVDRHRTCDLLERMDLLGDRVAFLPAGTGGEPPEAPASPLALMHIGPGHREDALAALTALYPRLVPRGIVAFDDSVDPAIGAVIEHYRATHGIVTPIERTMSGGAHWRKDGTTGAPQLL